MILRLRADLVLEAPGTSPEGPVWHPADRRLDWVEVGGSRIHRFDPATGSDTATEVGPGVGALAPRRNGGFVLAMGRGFHVLPGAGADPVELATCLPEEPRLMMNDGKCDPQGRFWAGSMSPALVPGAGSLFRLDADHRVTTMVPAVTISNGMDWSPDGDTMYYVDSFAYRVDAYAFDAASGRLGARRTVADVDNDTTAPPGFTVPDGLCVDVLGRLWVAIHGAGEVRCLLPTGEVVAVVDIPSAGVTSCCFGGAGLDELYITASAHGSGAGSLPAALYRVSPGVAGRPATMFAG